MDNIMGPPATVREFAVSENYQCPECGTHLIYEMQQPNRDSSKFVGIFIHGDSPYTMCPRAGERYYGQTRHLELIEH